MTGQSFTSELESLESFDRRPLFGRDTRDRHRDVFSGLDGDDDEEYEDDEEEDEDYDDDEEDDEYDDDEDDADEDENGDEDDE